MTLDTPGAEREAEVWEEQPPRPAGSPPVLAVDGFEGPLDWLLELARREQIDLRRLSLLQLVNAFGRALETALTERTRRADLTRWGEWLTMAAHLTWLRSRLLLPSESAEAKAAETEATALRRQLLEADAMRRAAHWLDERVQLGREVFGRGRAQDASSVPRGNDIVALFRACLVVLRVPEHGMAYALPRPPLWRVSDATARITRMLNELPEGGELGVFLPPLKRDGPEHELRCRAALASTLLAALELCRGSAVALTHGETWGPIRLQHGPGRASGAGPASVNARGSGREQRRHDGP